MIKVISKKTCSKLAFFMILIMLAVSCPVAMASMPVEDPYVDVYIPGGLPSNGLVSGKFNVETPNYKFVFDVGRGVGSELYLKKSGYPNQNVFMSTNTGSIVPGMYVNGQWYTAQNTDIAKKVSVRKAGKYMWELSIEGIKMANSLGQQLPVTVNRTFWFWEDKIYTSTQFYADSAVNSIWYAMLSTYYNKNLFNKYNNSLGDLNIPASGWLQKQQAIEDQYTIFSTSAPTYGAVTQSVLVKTDLDESHISIGRDLGGQAAEDRICSNVSFYNRDLHGGASQNWAAGTSKTLYTAFYFSGTGSSTAGVNDTNCDKYPLAFGVSDSSPAGAQLDGFDAARGVYQVKLACDGNNFYDGQQNKIIEAKLSLTNDNRNRKVRVQTYLSPYPSQSVTGNVAMLCDSNKKPVGIPVQTSKKWDGTITPNYVHSYVTIPLTPNESKVYWHRTAFHKWGNKTTVGLPSLDLYDFAFDPNYNLFHGTLWLESHVGESESACYFPDLQGTSDVADFRAQNGKKDNGVPIASSWFSNAGGHNLTKYWNGSTWVYPKRRDAGFRWDSVGPNLSQHTWVSRTPDGYGGATTTATAYLLPSTQGTRLFLKYRTDFTSTQTFGTGIKHMLNIFSLNDPGYGAVQKSNTIAYLNSSGSVSTVAVNHSTNNWQFTGTALSSSKPWVAVYDATTADGVTTNNNNGFVVHSFSGKINGSNIGMNNLCISLYSMTDGKSNVVLGPNVSSTQFVNGDYFDVLIELYTWSPDSGSYAPIQNERTRWLTTVTANTGTKVSDFPATVAASSEVADFTVTGGNDYQVIRATGFSSSSTPKLEEYVSGVWTVVNQAVNGNDYWQTDYVPSTGKYTYTFAVPADGGSHRYRITRY